MTLIQKKIVEVALSYVGEKETAGNSGFVNKKFLEKMVQTGWQKGWPWCSVWVELVWLEAYADFPQFPEKHQMAKKLITPSAVTTWNNFEKEGKTSRVPVPGALVVWRHGRGWQGHIGIVNKPDMGANRFETIEGNTNIMGGREGDRVSVKSRLLQFSDSKTGLNLLGFIPPL